MDSKNRNTVRPPLGLKIFFSLIMILSGLLIIKFSLQAYIFSLQPEINWVTWFEFSLWPILLTLILPVIAVYLLLGYGWARWAIIALLLLACIVEILNNISQQKDGKQLSIIEICIRSLIWIAGPFYLIISSKIKTYFAIKGLSIKTN